MQNEKELDLNMAVRACKYFFFKVKDQLYRAKIINEYNIHEETGKKQTLIFEAINEILDDDRIKEILNAETGKDHKFEVC